MTARVALGALAAWWLQSAVLVAVVALLVRLTRCRAPRAVAALWATALAGTLALPAAQALAPLPAPTGATLTLDAVLARSAGPQGPFPWDALLIIVLAAVTVVRLARLALRQRRLRLWALAGRPYTDEALPLDLLPSVGSLQMRICDRAGAPATFGARHPLVLLPATFPREPWGRRRDALLHELLHVRRRDWRESLAEEVLAEALWFQPALRFAVRERRLAREQSVDAEVVALTGDRTGYARTLLALASSHARPVLASMAASGLERRIDLLTREDSMSKTKTIVSVATTTAVAVVVSAVMAMAVPLPGAQRKDADAAAKARERKLIHKVDPAYPEAAKASGIEGIVRLDVLVTAAGEVTDVKVLDGPAELLDASTAAVRQWRYEAGDTSIRMTITIRYMLARKDG